MGVDFEIDQSELRRFRELESAKPAAGDSTFSLAFPDNSTYPVNGKIGLIDRAVDPQTGTIRVRLIFANATHELRPGMNCTIRIIHATKGPQIIVPYKAVLEQMGEYFVFMVDNNKVKELKVMLGPRVGANVIIEQGIQPGAVIVTDGIAKLSDGAMVSVGAPQAQDPKSSKF